MNSNGNWLIHVDASVYKSLARFPQKDAGRILRVLENLNTDPYVGDTHKLSGTEQAWRKRIGSYRIFYEIDATNKRIDVSEVERRSSKTY